MAIHWKTRARGFDELALPHLPALYRFARQIAGPDTAEDLVQETYLRAWKYFGSFDPATNCRAWLFRILRNVWINQWRKSSLELPVPELEEKALEPYYGWEDELLASELSAEMEASDGLPDRHRHVPLESWPAYARTRPAKWMLHDQYAPPRAESR